MLSPNSRTRLSWRRYRGNDRRHPACPKPGEETHRALKGYARKTEEELIEKAQEARAALDEMIEHGKHFVAEKRADVEAAVKAGREAMKERMDKCCS